MEGLLNNLVNQEGDCGSELLSMVEHYIHRCCRTYYTLGYSEQQDIAQEASIRLLLNYESIKRNISKRWLYVMVKNLCIDELRKQRNANQLRLPESKEESHVPPPDIESFERSGELENRDCLNNVFGYIASQPTGQEDLIIYSHFAYGLSRSDIAQVTGRTVNAVTKRISILRSRLKSIRDELC